MINIRGHDITITPLTDFEYAKVAESFNRLGTCTPSIKVLEPENLAALVNVVTAVVRRTFPDATTFEVSESLTRQNLSAVLNGLTSSIQNAYIYQEASHVQ